MAVHRQEEEEGARCFKYSQFLLLIEDSWHNSRGLTNNYLLFNTNKKMDSMSITCSSMSLFLIFPQELFKVTNLTTLLVHRVGYPLVKGISQIT